MSENSSSQDKKLDFSFQEVESYLDSILNNQRLEKLELPDGRTRFVVFSFPNAKEILASRFIRDKAQVEAADKGLPTIAEMDERLYSRGLLKDVESKIGELQEKIKGQRAILEKTQIPGRRDSIEEIISNLEDEIFSLKSQRENYYYLTQERKADEESYLYLVWASTYDLDGTKYWDTFEDFEDETDLVFRNQVLMVFPKFNVGYSAKIVRYLARHSLWRIRFVAATKTGAGSSLFCRSFNDLTPDQLSLLYWSNYYQSIYEMLPDDQPPSDIIADDEKLDKYMEEYFKEKEAERNESKAEKRSDKSDGSPKGYQPKLNAWKRGEELIITPAHPDYTGLAYTEQRIKPPDGVSDVEVIAPNSRRARNRRARNRSIGRRGKRR